MSDRELALLIICIAQIAIVGIGGIWKSVARMNDCYYADCELFRNNEHCMDSITFCEKSLAEHDAKVRADAIDEYENKLLEFIQMRVDTYFYDLSEQDLAWLKADIKNLAEQLKEQGIENR